MRSEPRRLVAATISIVFGVAFLVMALLAGSSLTAGLTAAARESVGSAAVVATLHKGPLIDVDAPDRVRALGGVTSVRTVVHAHLEQELPGRQNYLLGQTLPALSPTTRVVSGRLPTARGEVAVNEVTASSQHLGPGDPVKLRSGAGEPAQATVVGVLATGPDVTPTTGMPMLFASDADLMAWRGSPGYDELFVAASGNPEVLAEQMRALLPGATIRTGEAEVAARVKAYTSGLEQLTAVFAGFGVVALFVTGLVIANTFAILVAQRTRQLALLRCVGATRTQVFRSVVAEAAVVGLVGSVLGVALGVGSSAALIAAAPATGLAITHLAVTPLAIIAPLVAGVLLTIAAALVPARHATAIAPLAALRPQPVDAGRRTGRIRLAVGTLSCAAGVALLVWGVSIHQVVAGIAGGILSFAGVLVVAPLVVPAAAAVLGIGARGVTGRLAVANSRRNPTRAAATAGALLVGVTLVTMMSVGAETGRATIEGELGRRVITDAQVLFPSGVSDAARHRLDTNAEVAGWTEAVTLTAEVSGKGPQTVVAVGPQATGALRDTAAIAGLADGVITVPPKLAAEGEAVTVTFGSDSITLRAHVTGGLGGTTGVITLADARRLHPEPPTQVLVRFVDSVQAASAVENLASQLAEVTPGVQVQGAAIQRQELQSTIDTVLLVAVALLGVAVVIAVVGIGNTLGLSVLERRQETGLLRALGLTRGQVRSLLGIEALTLAGVAVLLGLALGTVYGLAGIATVVAKDVPFVPSVPWPRLALIAAVALAAGWLASVLPAARAARVPPAAALAFE